jgi:hypothetical protein
VSVWLGVFIVAWQHIGITSSTFPISIYLIEVATTKKKLPKVKPGSTQWMTRLGDLT